MIVVAPHAVFDFAAQEKVLLVLLQVALNVVLLCLFVFCLIPLGTAAAVSTGFAVHCAGFGSTWLLTRAIPRLAFVWVACFAFPCAAITPFAGYEYLIEGTVHTIGFWLPFTVSVIGASFLGAAFALAPRLS